MADTLYPTVQEVLRLHQLLTERYGGEGGVRDLGLLESALFRPRSGYYETLDEQAAALLHSLAKNHAFIDGNKRVAFAVTAIFLRLNGYRLVVDADEAECFLIDRVICGDASVPEISSWLKDHAIETSAGSGGRR